MRQKHNPLDYLAGRRTSVSSGCVYGIAVFFPTRKATPVAERDPVKTANYRAGALKAWAKRRASG